MSNFKRNENESFEDYRNRRAEYQARIKYHLRGKSIKKYAGPNRADRRAKNN